MNQAEEFEHAIISPNIRTTNSLYKQAMLEGAAFEREAERCRMEAERAYEDVGTMKAEGRSRARVERPRLLPSHERSTDARTNTFKAMGDAKGDVAFYMSMATMYAQLASMKFAKAPALRGR